MAAYLNALDVWLFYLINREGQLPLLDLLMPVVSNINYFLIPLGIAWLYLITRRGPKPRIIAVAILLLVGSTDALSSRVLKPLLDRPRPYDALSQVHLHHHDWTVTPKRESVTRGRSYSLPSTHATNIFGAALFLSYYFRKGWPWLYLVALLVGYSRVYLGAHYPLDVGAGAVVGTLCALMFVWAADRCIGYYNLESKP